MKNVLRLCQLILITISILYPVDTFDFCCCIYTKDPFRGFECSNASIMTLKLNGILDIERQKIGLKILNLCRSEGGTPTIENINRIKQIDTYTLTTSICEKECFFIIREMNERFDVEQEWNRLEEAKKLRERRTFFLRMLEVKIQKSTKRFYNGEKYKGENKISNKEKPQMIKNVTKETDLLDRINVSFDSVSECSVNEEDEFDKYLGQIGLDSHYDYDRDNRYSISSSQSVINTGIDIDKETEKLDNHIMYLEKKNQRPLDYILDRFSIPDDILVQIIKLFESTLEYVIKKTNGYFESEIFFQFEIADKVILKARKK
jgi:hypothetical protein